MQAKGLNFRSASGYTSLNTSLWTPSPNRHVIHAPSHTLARRIVISASSVLSHVAKQETAETTPALRQCSTCSKVKDVGEFHREPIEPFVFRRECKACVQSRGELPITRDLRRPFEEQQRLQKNRGKRALRKADKEQNRFVVSMKQLDWSASVSGDAAVILAAKCLRDPQFLEERLVAIATLMCLSREATISLLDARRELLLLSPELLAVRMLELRKAVPFGDITELVRLSPWLLLLDDVRSRIKPALKELWTMMKGGTPYTATVAWHDASASILMSSKFTYNECSRQPMLLDSLGASGAFLSSVVKGDRV